MLQTTQTKSPYLALTLQPKQGCILVLHLPDQHDVHSKHRHNEYKNHYFSFFPSMLWYNLLEGIRSDESLISFKSLLKMYFYWGVSPDFHLVLV